MNHPQKIKLARKMIALDEIQKHIPLFSSMGWLKRKNAIESRLRPQPIIKKVPVKEIEFTEYVVKSRIEKLSWWQKLIKWIWK